MANIDGRANYFGTSFALAAYGNGRRSVEKCRVDLTDQNLAQNDVLYLMTIPANSRINSVDVRVVTPEGEAATVHIGDYSDLAGSAVDADGWVKAVSINGAAGTGGGTGGNTEAYGGAGGKYYPAAAYLCITAPDAVTYDTGVFDVYVDILQLDA